MTYAYGSLSRRLPFLNKDTLMEKHKIVRYRSGFHTKVDAETAFEECERIVGECQSGDDHCRAVVEASRPKTAVLHDVFEWKDSVAADMYRRSQAGKLLRSFEVIINHTPPVRAFETFKIVEVGENGPRVNQGPRVYHKIEDVMADPALRNELLTRAVSELRSLRKKYAALEQLAKVFAAIDDFDESASG